MSAALRASKPARWQTTAARTVFDLPQCKTFDIDSGCLTALTCCQCTLASMIWAYKKYHRHLDDTPWILRLRGVTHAGKLMQQF
jgi:hypothetical protein